MPGNGSMIAHGIFVGEDKGFSQQYHKAGNINSIPTLQMKLLIKFLSDRSYLITCSKSHLKADIEVRTDNCLGYQTFSSSENNSFSLNITAEHSVLSCKIIIRVSL